MTLVIPLLLLSTLIGAGAASYIFFVRYGDARARELGISPEQARAGRVDDAGSTRFDREMFREVVQGKFQRIDAETAKLGRVARALTFASALLAIAGARTAFTRR